MQEHSKLLKMKLSAYVGSEDASSEFHTPQAFETRGDTASFAHTASFTHTHAHMTHAHAHAWQIALPDVVGPMALKGLLGLSFCF